jgi:hypothetical protein
VSDVLRDQPPNRFDDLQAEAWLNQFNAQYPVEQVPPPDLHSLRNDVESFLLREDVNRGITRLALALLRSKTLLGHESEEILERTVGD